MSELNTIHCDNPGCTKTAPAAQIPPGWLKIVWSSPIKLYFIPKARDACSTECARDLLANYDAADEERKNRWQALA